MPMLTRSRTGLSPRLIAAVFIGIACGGVLFGMQHMMPSPQPAAPTDCSASDVASGIGCLVGGLLADLFIGAFLWLVGIVVTSLIAGAVFGWLADRLFGVWIGIPTILLWIPILWLLPNMLAPIGITVDLNSPVVIGYAAAVIVVLAAINWPKIPLPARLGANGIVVFAALLALGMG